MAKCDDPPPDGSTVTKRCVGGTLGVFRAGRARRASMTLRENARWCMSDEMPIVSRASNSGWSAIMARIFLCLRADCHGGKLAQQCVHVCGVPAAWHATHAMTYLCTTKNGSPFSSFNSSNFE